MKSIGTVEISLVIATFNRAKPLMRLLEHLQRQTLDKNLWEVVVSIDGSTDDTVEVLKSHEGRCSYQLTWLLQENSGPAKARHQGILRASGKHIAILDDDMEPCPDFLAMHLKSSQIFAGKTVVIGRINVAPQWKSKPLHDVVGEYQRSQLHDLYMRNLLAVGVDGFATGNVSFPKDLYLTVGGFDFEFRIDEDRELGYRFVKGGGRLMFCQDASAIHHSDVGPVASWLRRWKNYGHSGIKVWRKHKEDVSLHPLRHFVHGSIVNRNLVRLLIPFDKLAEIFISALGILGYLLQKCGIFMGAVACFRVILSLQYHRGFNEAIGGWEQFKSAERVYRQDLANSSG